eukprot:TRINITY_DN7294_c0_g1_i1.p1 TRINITY_DN7294_c0_g1~~TRINITY_DN7294_c0_g1_i1.p1  ORF type:complete len:1029 (+),score=292.95 TRINITY_DN7294_c0_g1_i1:162-3248(+)
MGQMDRLRPPGVEVHSDGGSDEDEAGLDSNGLERKLLTGKAKDARQVLGQKSQGQVRGDVHVPKHLITPRPKMGYEERTLIGAGIKRNRFCNHLNDDQVDAIIDVMEYYEFETDTTIVREGDFGCYFFVCLVGRLEVFNEQKVINSLGSGDAFGAISLLYDCPRTASVVAKEKNAGVWGALADDFKRVLKEQAQKELEQNRKFMNHIAFFDGLPARDRELIGEKAMHVMQDAGTRVITEGEAPTAVYLVKEGELEFVSGGKLGANGKLEGGKVIGTLKKGDCFGWRAIVNAERENSTVIAKIDCSLVSIGLRTLAQVLGENYAEQLERNFIVSMLVKIPAVAILRSYQIATLAGFFSIQKYKEGEKMSSARIAIVVDGCASCKLVSGKAATVGRGQWCQDASLRTFMEAGGQGQPQDTCDISVDVAAGLVAQASGHGGEAHALRVAFISPQSFAEALSKISRDAKGSIDISSPKGQWAPQTSEDARMDADDALVYLRKLSAAKKVPIFSELSEEQVDYVVTLLKLRAYGKGTDVFKQGDQGSEFYIIAQGEVDVIVDGQVAKTIGQNACFGERAILFNEKRSATTKVRSQEAELWILDRKDFDTFVSDQMKQSLIKSINLTSKGVTLKMLKHVRLIGKGSFGSVRQVEHKRTGQRYALKRIKVKEGEDPPDDVLRECDVLGTIQYPFIMRMVTTFKTSHSIYLLTELITGGQMYDQVLAHLGILNRKGAQFYIGTLVLILEFLHEHGVVYRDLKPENTMLDAQGYLKLVDFGLAKRLDQDNSRTYSLVGTLYYMSPEVIRGQGYGFECDTWSLGVMMFEMVCGYLPFGHDLEDNEIVAEILDNDLSFPGKYTDSAGKRLIKGLLEKDVEKRLGGRGHLWHDIRNNKFFSAGVTGNLFSKIQGRELKPPVVPSGEAYTDEGTLQTVTLSDSEELGKDEPVDIGCRVLSSFKKFDINGDGLIDREELGQMLGAVNPKAFTKEVIDELMAAVDTDCSGKIEFGEFVEWIFEDEGSDLCKAFRQTVDLEIHD